MYGVLVHVRSTEHGAHGCSARSTRCAISDHAGQRRSARKWMGRSGRRLRQGRAGKGGKTQKGRRWDAARLECWREIQTLTNVIFWAGGGTAGGYKGWKSSEEIQGPTTLFGGEGCAGIIGG